jgi:3'-phosphoadenosine 5'-phosphosulfate sulfotransferase
VHIFKSITETKRVREREINRICSNIKKIKERERESENFEK